MSTWQVPFPHWKVMLPQLAFFFFFEDMFHYFGKHVLFHRLFLAMLTMSHH